jgi:hypothetical protein
LATFSCHISELIITLTRAPITPKLVSRKYSKGFVLLSVFKKGYKYSGILAKIINGEEGKWTSNNNRSIKKILLPFYNS